MNRPDDEFDDFLARRKPIFSRPAEPLEPPDEVDRVVLRQAREAIQGDRPQRVFKGPRWGAPLAIAATLVLAISAILHVGMPAKEAPVPSVTVQTISQRLESAPAPAARSLTPNNYAPAEVAAPAARAAAADSSGAAVVDRSDSARAPLAAGGGLVSEEEANRYASAPAAAPMAGVVIDDPVSGSQTVVTNVSPPPTEAGRAVAKAAPAPAFRRDPKTWLAEIERLRAAGKGAQADAEFAQYKREHRAYAVAPDR
jgi:hypothetical protein